jgi:flagellar basal body-associated protein FliL
LSEERDDAALRAKLRKILIGVTIGCLALGAAGYFFVRWLATLPPGTLKTH